MHTQAGIIRVGTTNQDKGPLAWVPQQARAGYADRVGGIVVGRPDVEGQEQQAKAEETLQLEHCGKVGLAVEGAEGVRVPDVRIHYDPEHSLDRFHAERNTATETLLDPFWQGVEMKRAHVADDALHRVAAIESGATHDF